MKRIIVQALKEWAEFRRDRLSLALALILPLATLLLFGYGVRLKASNIPLVVQDMDNSRMSRSLVDGLLATNVFASGDWNQRSDPEDVLEDGGARAAVVIPPGFGRDLQMLRPVSFQTLIDGSDLTSAEMVRAAVRGATSIFLYLNLPPDPHRLYVQPHMRIWFNPGSKEALFIVPGVFAIILWMYPALLAAVAIAREIEQSTIVQVYASDMSALEALLGKALFYLLVGLAQALLILVVAHLLFGLTLQCTCGPLVLCSVIYVAGAVFFGLLAGIISKHQTVAVQAAATGGFFPALLLSGFVYPIRNIPFPLSLACDVVPARYYIEVCRDAFMRGLGWRSVWYEPLILTAFALVLLTGSWMRMRRMQVED